MFNRYFYRTSVTLGLTFLALSMQYCQASPRMTEQQVIAKAQLYIRTVSGSQAADDFVTNCSTTPINRTNPVSGVKIQHLPPDPPPDNPANHDFFAIMVNHPTGYWKINVPGKMEIEVNDSTGWIMNYVNYQTISGNDFQPADGVILKSLARASALKALQATGAPLNNLKLNFMQETNNNVPEWYVDWLRTFRGIPYHGMGAHVGICADTGEVIYISMPLEMINPQVNSENITKVQAVDIATKQLNAVNLFISEVPLAEITKEVVPGNRFWQSGDDEHHTLQTHVVWNCHFGPTYDSYEVWVDTTTGDVIGGCETGSLGSDITIKPKPIYGHQLKYSEVKNALEQLIPAQAQSMP